MQRPLRSQSPKRVGSGPEGPPISRGRWAVATASAVATGLARESRSVDGTEDGVEEFFTGLISIHTSVPELDNGGHDIEASPRTCDTMLVLGSRPSGQRQLP